MTDLFHVEALDLATQPQGTKQVWYVKEGDFLHCTCDSEEAGRLSLQHFKDVHQINASLARMKILHETLTAEEHVFVVETELAAQAVGRLKAVLELEAMMQAALDSADNDDDSKAGLSNRNKNGLKG